MTFDELMQKYVNLPYEELVSLADSAFADFGSALVEKVGDDDGAAKFLILLAGTCIGIDDQVTALEGSFLNDVLETEFDYDTLVAMMEGCNSEKTRNFIDEVIDSFDEDNKAALCIFCTCLMAVDETITRKEVAFIKKLMG